MKIGDHLEDMRTKFKQIIFSVIFAILFLMIFFMELFDFIKYINTSDYLSLILSLLALIVSSVGVYVSIIWGVVRLLNKDINVSGGNNHGKKKKQKS